MTILTRYILGEFLRVLLMSLFGLVGLYILVNFVGKLDDFVDYQASLSLCFSHYFYKLPKITFEIAPVAFLVATLVTFSNFTKNTEFTAMKACGFSLMRLSIPIIIASIVYASLSIVANEFIVPYATKKASYILNREIRKRNPKWVHKGNRAWLRSDDGSLCKVGLIDNHRHALHNVSIFRYDGKENLRERVDAAKAIWENGHWIFCNGSIRTFEESGVGISENFERRKVFFPIVPADLVEIKLKREEMSIREIYAYAQRMKRSGMENFEYMVDLHHEIAFPFISLACALIGIAFSIKSGRSGGVMRSLVFGFVLGLFYHYIFNIGISFGHSGILPPFLAAWGINLFFIAIGFYLVLTLDSETLLPPISFRKKLKE